MGDAIPLPDWLHLKQYGYAPGGYMNRCHACKVVFHDLDKLASTCRPCAEQMHAAAVTAAKDAEIAALRAEVAGLREALTKIDALRNDIIGRQSIGWSSHVYPLVAALDAAGYPGKSYEEARAALAARKGEA